LRVQNTLRRAGTRWRAVEELLVIERGQRVGEGAVLSPKNGVFSTVE
jgi:hypothetical protein